MPPERQQAKWLYAYRVPNRKRRLESLVQVGGSGKALLHSESGVTVQLQWVMSPNSVTVVIRRRALKLFSLAILEILSVCLSLSVCPLFSLGIVRFELKASWLLDSFSTTGGTSLAFFCYGYFGDRVSLFAQKSLDHDPSNLFPAVAGMTGACHHTQRFSIVMVSHNLFMSRLTWNHDAPDLSLIAWDDRCIPPCPAILEMKSH
jgi:hypothetical protein